MVVANSLLVSSKYVASKKYFIALDIYPAAEINFQTFLKPPLDLLQTYAEHFTALLELLVIPSDCCTQAKFKAFFLSYEVARYLTLITTLAWHVVLNSSLGSTHTVLLSQMISSRMKLVLHQAGFRGHRPPRKPQCKGMSGVFTG